MKRYRVMWIVKRRSIRPRHGSWLSYSVAKAAVDCGNRKYPEIKHWVDS